jgi:cell division protein FtsA
MLFRGIRKGTHHPKNELIGVLDIGSSKVSCVIARVDGPDYLQVIGVGHQLSKGLRGGHIIDMQEAELSILNAVHLAEQMAKEIIREVYINVPSCFSRTVGAELPVPGHAVDDADMRRLLTLARQVQEPQGQQPIHTIPTSYEIDGRKGIRDPRSMYGETLGVDIHTIYSSTSNLRNLSTCIARCHLAIKAFVATPFASGLATLVEDEIDLGVTVIDMGAGNTSIGIFFEGNIIHTDSIPVGGGHVTNDIARVLSTPVIQAERLKTLHGSVLSTASDEREMVKVPQIGEIEDHPNRQISKAELVRIIKPRIEETFDLVRSRLNIQGLANKISHRVVLTGGGCQLPGIQEMASLMLEKQVRIGRPLQMQGLHDSIRGPSFATCVGLLAYAHMEQSENTMFSQLLKDPKTIFGRVGLWLRENL